ncbi:cytochrome b/b6 domain-containing protein [Actinotalea sp. M2MS4P-6]|uniref:cytochrome b/b6 domain-containing protein n=1 Tax=Actinotalea sp. M2MS4P-6 TaxID=2983762 RepID=UPI0021E48948|nr:cytochrome b/b6 domain-containing protein [Actinotalea sp. M2MS4P-6]MCV2393829.1 cytochrome b/b6 domain-containing protein [Actinotalea sp. M2MS4P-6]
MAQTLDRSPVAIPRPARLALAGAAGLGLLVVAGRLLWRLDAIQDFVARYPGVAPGAEQVGTPGWVAVLHAANLLLITLAVRSGLAIRTSRRPAGHWTRRRRAGSGRPTTVTLEQWFHVSVDMAWLAVGAAYVLLLATSGRWVRLVPTTWEVVPNALSVALQYLALHWPQEHGWVAYNALQMLGYATVVLVLAPLAAVTGLRTSVLWPWPNVPVLTLDRARAIHFPVMVAFVGFVVLHVSLVAGTGVVRNLNHMFGLRDDGSVVGPLVALGVLALAVLAWLAVRPTILRPLGALVGKVTR